MFAKKNLPLYIHDNQKAVAMPRSPFGSLEMLLTLFQFEKLLWTGKKQGRLETMTQSPALLPDWFSMFRH